MLRGVWTVSPTEDESLKVVVAISAAEPPSFLVLRYASVCALMGVLALVAGARWTRRRDAFRH